jgi:hypothetical protein
MKKRRARKATSEVTSGVNSNFVQEARFVLRHLPEYAAVVWRALAARAEHYRDTMRKKLTDDAQPKKWNAEKKR